MSEIQPFVGIENEPEIYESRQTLPVFTEVCGMNCTRCEGTGFLNSEQIETELINKGHVAVIEWLSGLPQNNGGRCSCHLSPPCGYCETLVDVAICDCCGDGDGWYGEPGEHAEHYAMCLTNEPKTWRQKCLRETGYIPLVTCGAVMEWLDKFIAGKDDEIERSPEILAHPCQAKCDRCGIWGRNRVGVGDRLVCYVCFSYA